MKFFKSILASDAGVIRIYQSILKTGGGGGGAYNKIDLFK